MKRIYLDYASTTPVDDRVLKVMLPYYRKIYGNPASLHTQGQQAKAALERARSVVARMLNVKPSEIVFTSGGSESINHALKGAAFASRNTGHIITTAVEHHAVLETCSFLRSRGFRISIVPVDGSGMADPDDIRRAILPETILVSVMHANNEVGTIQPVEEIGSITRERGVLFHIDSVQTFGHIPFTAEELGADFLSVSAHKLYGPKGVGALYIRKDAKITPLIHGGEQETGRRASTQNIPGIVGFARAVEIARSGMNGEARRLTRLRERLEREILDAIPGSRLNGHPERRLPGNVNISFSGIDAMALLLSLDLKGIACSTGSACSSASLEPSHVLRAMGLSTAATRGSLRMSLGRGTEESDIAQVVRTVSTEVRRLRGLSPTTENGESEG
ncbi:MAG: cysteine desulfurase family protein [Spirochaetota bacterium]